MIKAYSDRSKGLKQIDTQREANRAWFGSSQLIDIILYVDRLNKDLKGLEEKLSYLKELGINYLHLISLLKSLKRKMIGVMQSVTTERSMW